MCCPLTRETTSTFSGITTDASVHCWGFGQYWRLKNWKPEGAEFPSALSSVAWALPCGVCLVSRARGTKDGPCIPPAATEVSCGIVPAGVFGGLRPDKVAGCTTISSFSWIEG